MKQLVIIGAGGMGRTFVNWVKESEGYGIEYRIKGFIDDNLEVLYGFEDYPPILGTIKDYIPENDDVFICAIGGKNRETCIRSILNKNGDFINLIHHSARIDSHAKIGKGNIFGPNVSVGPDAVIGNYNLLQNYVIIGHDVCIGDFNRFDTRVLCVGGIEVDNCVTIHSSSVIGHNVVIENYAVVGACSFVIRKVKSGTTVFGNPAKKLV